MARHLRNQLAREGFVFRSGLVCTLSKFIEPLLTDVRPAPAMVLESLIGEALARLAPQAFQAVKDRPGFRAALGRTMEEVSSAGCSALRLQAAVGAPDHPILPDFIQVYQETENLLAARGFALRGRRLQMAADRVLAQGLGDIGEVWFDGFFNFAEPELDLIAALLKHASVSVTLPEWPGAEPARRRLRSLELVEQHCGSCRRHPEYVLLEAQTQEREAEEIAARILELAGGGLLFREIGIVVRQRDPYVPLLRATLERFGIPARFYFPEPLEKLPVVRYFQAVIEAALSGWEHGKTLAAFRMAPSGLAAYPQADDFEFRVKEQFPGAGLGALLRLTSDPVIRRRLESFARLDGWRTERLSPEGWAGRFTQLRQLVELPPPPEKGPPERTAPWRAAAAAIAAFEETVRQAAQLLPGEPVSIEQFWRQVEEGIRLSMAEIADDRRNVVHVLEVHEARQWELPVVFVCGLLEDQFPQRPVPDPFVPDEIRRGLRAKGIRLPSTADKDLEEEFLFEFALSRAVRTVVLSYPLFNQKGEETLRSFLLERFLARTSELTRAATRRVRPEPFGPKPSPPRSGLGEDLREHIAARYSRSSPTALETFLQCPFQFFAKETLSLREPPPEPAERFDALVQGDLIHSVLKHCLHRAGQVYEAFEKLLEQVCRQKRIPEGYRKEAIRLELLRSLSQLQSRMDVPGVRRGVAEQQFEFPLDSRTAIVCRLDRIDVADDGRRVIIDYKYSTEQRVKDLVEAHQEKRKLQAGLYLMALSAAGHECAGVLFLAAREKPAWVGWLSQEMKLNGVRSCSAEGLAALADLARQAATEAIQRIREGEIRPQPADPELCPYCAYRDICRFEAAGRAAAAGEGEESWR